MEKAGIYRLAEAPDPERPNFIWSYRCTCGYQGGVSASPQNAQKGVNGHMGNAHRGQRKDITPDGIAWDGTVSLNLRR